MVNITLEQIDLIMQRANVSYAEAKEALIQTNGDVVEALLLLEKTSKIKTTKDSSSTQKVTSFIDKLNATTFILKKKDRVYVDVPLSIALIAILLSFHVSIVALIIVLFFGIRIDIKGENDVARKINSTMNQFKD